MMTPLSIVMVKAKVQTFIHLYKWLPWWIIGHDIIIEIPEDVSWGLWGVGYDTGQVDGGAPVYMEIRRALDPHMRYWKIFCSKY